MTTRSPYVAKVRELMEQNPRMTAPEIAEQVGCTAHLVYGICSRHGLPLYKPGRLPNVKARAFIDTMVREQPCTITSAAEATGISFKWAQELVKRTRIKLHLVVAPDLRAFLDRQAKAMGKGVTAEQAASAILADAMHDEHERRAAE